MKRLALLFFAVALAIPSVALAGKIPYIEGFSLAKDRTVPLAQLIPGTEDYFYYNALNLQNQGKYDEVDSLLKAWIKKHDYTGRVREILNRQALLKYEKDPQKSLEYIRQQLNLHFNHQREIPGQKPDVATTLDPKLISRETLTARAFSRQTNLDGFEDAGLLALDALKLNPQRRRSLLSRLKRPDFPNLTKLVVDDLNYQHSRGFGSMNIHKALLLDQLRECLRLKPDLLNQTHFVNAWLTKLHPNPDVDWRNDPKARAAYLDRLMAYARTLDPVHNSLKANILYHRLQLDLKTGNPSRERFMEYVKLPRRTSYVNPEYLKRDECRRWPVNLGANYSSTILLPPVGNDEPLVRAYLHHFFVDDKDYKALTPYINDLYLKHNFAEVKIVNGIGDQQQWYAMLPAEKYRQLKDRIDIDFARTNKDTFATDEGVQLDIDIKNVKTLIVKVFEINTENYYRRNLRHVSTDINLDGLVANEEKTYKYTEPPLRRVRRNFTFENMKKPGVYVIDFIGNGKSSRALIRKGQLRYLVRTGVAGQVFTIVNENNKKVPGGKIFLGNHEYTARPDGTIIIPFSTNPGERQIVLAGDGMFSLTDFNHKTDTYDLDAGIYVDRESLIKQKKARVVIRPTLRLNGKPVTLSILEDVTLVLNSQDIDGVKTSKDVPDFKLFEDRESTYEFQVPPRLSRIGFQLKAKVKRLTTGDKVDLNDGHNFMLNQIDNTDKVVDILPSTVAGIHVIDLLGRTGEPLPDRAVDLTFKHREFRRPVNVTLKTDARGRITLGTLEEIDQIYAIVGSNSVKLDWRPTTDRHNYPGTIHAVAGTTIEIPYMGTHKRPVPSAFSLLETRGNTFVIDHFKALSIADGMLRLKNLSRGDYDLLLEEGNTRIRIRVAEGDKLDNYVLGRRRELQLDLLKPIQIAGVKTGEKEITIQLANASKFSRVHVFATRFHPSYSAFTCLRQRGGLEPGMVITAPNESLYLTGRDIGDEYRYIIDRRYAKIFPGNMLTRPELLLNPWAIRKTETGHQQPDAMGGFSGSKKGKVSRHGGGSSTTGRAATPNYFSNLDFLANGSAVLVNLVPDDKGVITISRAELGPHQDLRIVAVDPENTAMRAVSLTGIKAKKRDLRLIAGLDPAVHYTQQKQISILDKGTPFELDDITSSKFESYDSLAKVYNLYLTLSGNNNLVEFSFILNWHKMTEKEKQEKYSKYACHELSFFISKKDPEFFKKVVKPYLANKKDKTFLDHWLLEEDLSDYLDPWAYAQLNVPERVLLGQRLKGEAAETARHIKEKYDLLPPDIERFNRLFATALKRSALDAAPEELAEAIEGEYKSKIESANKRLKSFGAMTAESAPAAAKRPTSRALAERKAAGIPETDSDDLFVAGDEAEAKAVFDNGDFAMARRRSSDKKKADYYLSDRDARERVRQLYRKLDKTQEWVENNYYHLPIGQQNAGLVTVGAFWKDYSNSKPGTPFRSKNLAEASRNFTEMMFALAVLDLPAESPEQKMTFKDATMDLTVDGPMIVFHQEIRQAQAAAQQTPILVSQNFFRHGDRYTYVDNEKSDKFVTEEFLTHVVYGCQVVITNPTSSRQKLDVLLQIPVGAIPVLKGKFTRTLHIDLQPYNTQRVEYYFYFPAPGKFPHYPVQVARNEDLIAYADPFVFNVVIEPTKIDRESWDYISQQGTDQQVVNYLKNHNLLRTNLDRIAFRMADKDYFKLVTDLLRKRHVYNNTLWSYSIKHDVTPAIAEYLQHMNNFVNQCGAYIDSPLLVIDPVARKAYEHMEYSPLVNARAHQLGRVREIVNERVLWQYTRLLRILSYRNTLDDDDLMAVTYYLLLQDRVEEAIGFFTRVNPENLATRIQYDYAKAYIAFYKEDAPMAGSIAGKYAQHPVDRWRKAFAQVAAQVKEIKGAAPQVTDTEDRTQVQTDLAATQPSLDFKVEAQKLVINFQNLESVRVNFYLMDIELLFSQNPFVQKYTGQFSNIRPNTTEVIKLPKEKATHTAAMPKELLNKNVLVEVIGGGQTRTQAWYSNSMAVQVIDTYGQVRVTDNAKGKPLPKVYVKVYARMKNGTVKFYKDGYTDLRGRFDFSSLSTNELDNVSRFSLLVLSDTHGAVVKEADPPKR